MISLSFLCSGNNRSYFADGVIYFLTEMVYHGAIESRISYYDPVAVKKEGDCCENFS